MANKPLPSQDVLRQLLDYDPETGALTWKERGIEWFSAPDRHKAWNSRYAGKPAFTAISNGYLVGAIKCIGIKRGYAHRVVWAIQSGSWPNVIDHIDGDKTNNRASNLRDVTHSENLRNMPRRKDNSSGHTGIYWSARDRGFYAHIRIAGQTENLGLFRCKTAALIARKRAERRLGFAINHGRAA